MTHYKYFINEYEQQEKIYSPNKSLISILHQQLDTIRDDNLALSIDRIVADLMRFEGYGKSLHYKEMTPPEIIYDDHRLEREEIR